MCVALPGRVEWIGHRDGASIPGRIRVGKALTEVDFILLPEVVVGDYVVAHSGYAVATVPEETVTETLELLAFDDPG